jgi:RHS repeat-associated protein
MMPAAKHGDPQMGIDIHLCIVPPSPSPVPLPTPHMSVVFDPFDYLPILGATVTVCGMKRAVAGTSGKAVHIPPGFPFAPKIPDTSDELFMGSATVVADGNPFSFLGVPVLSCQVAGMPSPPRPKQQEKKLMLLPTTVNAAIPTTVFIGGPPTISLMGMAFKLAFAGLGRLAKTKFAKALGKRFREWRKAKFGHLTPSFLKCKVLRAEPVNIVTGAVAVEQEDFTLPGLIPVRWTRRYASDSARLGACGTGWECPADARLEHDAESGIVLFHHPEGGIAIFGAMPAAGGDAAAVLELMDGALLSDHGGEYRVRTKEDRIYRFPKALRFDAGGGQRDYPLWQVFDLCGNSLTWERHHGSGRPLALVETAGRRIELEHGPDGLIHRVSLHVPESGFRHTYVEYEQDAAGDLVEVRDALGHPYRFDYDQHHMVRHTDRNGLSFHYEYDRSSENWRVVRSWGDGGLYAYGFAYLDAVNERRVTDSLGHTTLVKLDDRGLPINETDPLGGETIYEYDDAGRTVAVVDQDGHRTAYEYDERGNLTALTRPDGSKVAIAYDSLDKPVRITDPNGAVWQQVYDRRGLLIGQRDPEGRAWQQSHDAHGCLERGVSPGGNVTRTAFDLAGNPSSISDPAGRRWNFSHDPRGWLTASTDPRGATTRYVYDQTGRVLERIEPDGRAHAFEYDSNGDAVRYRTPDDRVMSWAYSALSVPVMDIHADGCRTRSLIDTEQQWIGITDEENRTTSFMRDALGRVLEQTDHNCRTWRYTYSAAGAVRTVEHPSGARLVYETDALQRITQKTLFAPGRDEPVDVDAFAYDANGNLIEMRNRAGTTKRRFDSCGRLAEEKHPSGATVENTYDEDGNRTERRIHLEASGQLHTRSTSFAYDAAGELATIDLDGIPHCHFLRDLAGRIKEVNFGQSLRHILVFDAAERLVSQQLRASDRLISEQVFAYDRSDDLVSVSDPTFGTESFAYDERSRLTSSIDGQGAHRAYRVTPAGDRLPSAPDLVTLGSEQARRGSHDGARYAFDLDGRLVERLRSGQVQTFGWSPQGRLDWSETGEHRTSYVYDPLGRRVRKETAREVVEFIWCGDVLAAEVRRAKLGGERAAVLREWIHLPDTLELVAQVEERFGGTAAGGARDRSVLYSMNFPNGAPSRLVDEAGNVRWAAACGAWGQARIEESAGVRMPLRLQGQYFDDETDLHYTYNRYFDPDSGSFISRDPLGHLAGTNLYEYAPNSFSWIDPLGLMSCKASTLPTVRKGTPQWAEAVAAIRKGSGDLNFRVATATEAKMMLKEARGNMNRYKRYTDKAYKKGFEMHPSEALSRNAPHNDLPHVKWKDWIGPNDGTGHIFFHTPN